MAEEVKEEKVEANPTTDEPKVEESPKVEETSKIDVDALLKEIENLKTQLATVKKETKDYVDLKMASTPIPKDSEKDVVKIKPLPVW